MGIVGNLVFFVAVKEFCKSIKNWLGWHRFFESWCRCGLLLPM